VSIVTTSRHGEIISVALNRPPVNAVTEALTDELISTLRTSMDNPRVKAIVLTGSQKFFSFGFDLPEFVTYPKESFLRFVRSWAELYTLVFLYPKPVVAALNGHTMAGGCMVAIACDFRIMVSGKAKIGLNEINFGSSLFPGSVVMLAHCVGARNAEVIAYSGAAYSAEEAKSLGLVDQVVSEEELMEKAFTIAQGLGEKHPPAFTSIKMLSRRHVAEDMKRKDELYRKELVDIWYSDHTWEQIKNIKIHHR
jgi:Delta3-Delta2-enoyl-CoA isomerase